MNKKLSYFIPHPSALILWPTRPLPQAVLTAKFSAMNAGRAVFS